MALSRSQGVKEHDLCEKNEQTFYCKKYEQSFYCKIDSRENCIGQSAAFFFLISEFHFKPIIQIQISEELFLSLNIFQYM